VADIVAALGVPHTPSLPAQVAREGPGSDAAQLFDAVERHLRAVQPDVLVIFDSDHLNTFFLDNLPLLSIGVAASTGGPNDGTPALPRCEVPIHESLAQYVRVESIAAGYELGVTQEFEVDHSILVPLHFLTPAFDVPIVPIFIGGIVPPLPMARRCLGLGQAVRDAVAAWPEHLRVAVLASGSISLDIGGPLAPRGHISGVADEAWVMQVVDYLQRSAIDELVEASTADRLARAGNIGGELLNWIALLGAIGPRQPVLVEPRMAHGDVYAAWRWDR
jgi:protocatechuate 4,5-dioxygenase beta chain